MPFVLTKDVLRRAALSHHPISLESIPDGRLTRHQLPDAVPLLHHADEGSVLLEAELQLHRPSFTVESRPGAGRGLVASQAFAEGTVILEEAAFGWVPHPLTAKNDAELLSGLVTRPDYLPGSILSRLVAMHPNNTHAVEVRSKGGGVEVHARTRDVLGPALHRSGVQTRMPVLPSSTTDIDILFPLNPVAGEPVQLLCVIFSMTNHACAPCMRYEPCWVSAEPTGSTCTRSRVLLPGLRLLAVRDIMPGEELTFPYVDPEADVQDRNARLQQGYNFTCECAKCEAERLEDRC